MNAAGSRLGLRLVVQVSALVAAGSLGFLLAAHTPTAAADGLLPTTITIPSLPVTLPTVSLPNTTSTGTTTTTTTTTTSTTATTTTATTTAATPSAASTGGTASGPSTAGAAAAPAQNAGVVATVAERTVAGALSLRGGSISIPVKTVAVPNGLLLVVAVTPRAVDGTRLLTTSVRVRDVHGYLVRGAEVTIRSVPNGLLDRAASKRSAGDGPGPAEDGLHLPYGRDPDSSSQPLRSLICSMSWLPRSSDFTPDYTSFGLGVPPTGTTDSEEARDHVLA